MIYFYLLKNHGVITPISMASLQFRFADAVELILTSGKTYAAPISDLELIDETEISNVLAALKSGIPYR